MGGLRDKEMMNFKHFKDKMSNLPCDLNSKKLVVNMVKQVSSLLVTNSMRISLPILENGDFIEIPIL